MILAVTIAVLIAIVWFGYRSHLKEQERASEEYAAQLDRQRRQSNANLNSLLHRATKTPDPSRTAPNFRDIGEAHRNTFDPISPLNPQDLYSVSDYDERISRNHRHDPTPACNNDTGSSSYSSSSNND